MLELSAQLPVKVYVMSPAFPQMPGALAAKLAAIVVSLARAGRMVNGGD